MYWIVGEIEAGRVLWFSGAIRRLDDARRALAHVKDKASGLLKYSIKQRKPKMGLQKAGWFNEQEN